MDYLKIVFNGFANPNNREYLVNYFFREFKKAEKEHFEADEFFSGCIKVIEYLESEMDKSLYKRKSELELMPHLPEAESDNTKTLEQRQKEMVDYCEKELHDISRNNFPVNLLHLSGNRFIGDFYYSHAIEIREAIASAMEEVNNPLKLIPASITYEQKDIERKMKKPPANIFTYDWTGKQQNKTVLHKAMKSVFIDKGTGLNDFCIIFEKKNTAGIKQVIWLRGATDLLQFLYEMMKGGLIKDETDRMSYKKLTACFCKEDGSQFNEAFKELFNPIKNGLTTQKKDIIELVKLHK